MDTVSYMLYVLIGAEACDINHTPLRHIMKKTDTAHEIFMKIYHAESDNIFRFCLVRVSDRDQALDLTQETFVRLWQTIVGGKEVHNPRAFLFTVSHRLIIDWYRKKKPLSLESFAGEDEDESYEPADKEGHDNLELAAEGRFLLDAIDRLGPWYRGALYLRFVEGLSPPEVGDILGMSANAASVRIHRGIEQLKKITGYDGQF